MKLNIISVLCVLQVGATLAEEGSTNAVLAATSQSGIVSVGPIIVTNGCNVNLMPDRTHEDVKLEVAVSKAKSELFEQNRERMERWGEKYEEKYKTSVREIAEEANKWYEKLKGVLDEARVTNGEMLTWMGIIFTIIGILVSWYGIVMPRKKEKERAGVYDKLKSDMDVLKDSLQQQQAALKDAGEQRKREFEKLQKEMKERTNSAYGVAVAYSALHEWDAYKSGGVLSKAVDSVYGAMVSVNAFVHGHEDGNLLKLCIKHLNATVERLKADGKFETVQKQLQNRKWPVTPEDVKKALASSADDGSGTDYAAMFNEVYGLYGKSR